MRVLVTGGSGKVGRHAAAALAENGHHVVLTDIVPARYGPGPRGELPYLRADLTDYGATIGTVMKEKLAPGAIKLCTRAASRRTWRAGRRMGGLGAAQLVIGVRSWKRGAQSSP